jgi:glycine/serine hydroxymethyltransferase
MQVTQSALKTVDPEVYDLCQKEKLRQQSGIQLIASEVIIILIKTIPFLLQAFLC